MSTKPIFMATHPRSCSTAFERVFMTRNDLKCIHEPFGDAFYYGPERLSTRFENDEKARIDSGFSDSTYETVFSRLEEEGSQGLRLFIKDIIHYLAPPEGTVQHIAPTLARKKRGVGTSEFPLNGVLSHVDKDTIIDESNNPTVVPTDMLNRFHFTFLIRHPRSSIPSYFRCTVPPLDEVTGFYNFMPSEAGISELRRVFDYLRLAGQIGPKKATHKSGKIEVNGGTTIEEPQKGAEICVVDADDLLDNPSGIIEAYCQTVGLEYDPSMLKWDTEEEQRKARVAFEKWKGFHEDAIESCDLKARTHGRKEKTETEEDAEWTKKFGSEGAKVIRDTVNANIEDYEYMKQFALKAHSA